MLQKLLISLFILLYSSSVNSQQQSFSDRIKEARTSSNDRITQVFSLLELEQELIKSEYVDTLGLLYYAISFRFRAIDSTQLQLEYAMRAQDEFEKIDYQGYQLPFSLAFIAEAWKEFELIDSALLYYSKIADLNLEGRGRTIYSNAIHKQSELLREREDYRSAIEIIDQCLKSNKAEWLSPQNKITLLLEASISYCRMNQINDIQLSKKYLNDAKEILNLQQEVDPVKYIELTMQEGLISLTESKYSDAINHYQQALKVRKTLSTTEINNDEITKLTSNISYVHLQKGDSQNALTFAKRAKEVFNSYGNIDYINTESLIYENLADAFIANENLDSAQYYVELGLNKFKKANIEESGLKRLWIFLLHIQAKINYESYNNTKDVSELVSGIKTIRKLDAIFNFYIDEQLSENSISNLKEDGSKYYKLGIEMAAKANDHPSFWFFSEKAKALALLRAHLNRKLKKKEQFTDNSHVLNRNIISLEYRIKNEKLNSSEIDILNKTLSKAKVQLQEINRQANNIKRNSLPINSYEKLDHSNVSIVQYKFCKDSLYALSFKKGTPIIYSLAAVDNIKKSIIEYRSLLSDPNANIEKINDLSVNMYDILIKPISLEFPNLLIIPDEELFLIPFDALKIDNKSSEYLLSSFSITTIPSASFLDEVKGQESNSKNHTIYRPNYSSSRTLGPLPFAKEESLKISNLVNGDLYATEMLDKEKVIHTFSNSSIIHFAGHAIIEEENSFLALGSSENLQSKILLKELYTLDIDADLVALSACNTGVGKILAGEGVASLSRGFLYGGARSVINTLWSVDDQASGQIFANFYKELSLDKTKDTALQQAKKTFLNECESYQRHPYYWAGITLVGVNSKMRFGHSPYRRVILGFGCCIILFFFTRILKSR